MRQIDPPTPGTDALKLDLDEPFGSLSDPEPAEPTRIMHRDDIMRLRNACRAGPHDRPTARDLRKAVG